MSKRWVHVGKTQKFWFLLRCCLLLMLYKSCSFIASEAWYSGFTVGTQGELEVRITGTDTIEGLISDWDGFFQVLPVMVVLPMSAVIALAHADARRESRGEKEVCDGYLFVSVSEGPAYAYGTLLVASILSLLKEAGWEIEKTRNYVLTNVIFALLAVGLAYWADCKLRKVRGTHEADPRNSTLPCSPALGAWKRVLENLCATAAWMVAISWTHTLFLLSYEWDQVEEVRQQPEWSSDSADVMVSLFSVFGVLFEVCRTHLLAERWANKGANQPQASEEPKEERPMIQLQISSPGPQDSIEEDLELTESEEPGNSTAKKPDPELETKQDGPSKKNSGGGVQEAEESASENLNLAQAWPMCWGTMSQFARAMHGLLLLLFLEDNSPALREGLVGKIEQSRATVGELYALWGVVLVVSLTVLLIPKLIKWACDERYDQEKLQRLEDTQYRSRFFWTTLAARLDLNWKITVGFVFAKVTQALVVQYVQPHTAVRWFVLSVAMTAGVYGCARLFTHIDAWLKEYTRAIEEDDDYVLAPLDPLALKLENAALQFRLRQVEAFLSQTQGFETKTEAEMLKVTRNELTDEQESDEVGYHADHSYGYA